RLRAALADDDDWRLPEPEVVRRAAGSAWDSALLGALRFSGRTALRRRNGVGTRDVGTTGL
ncbi:MAG: hypothetical protein ACXW3X_09580, partial [Rhodoplanes sp.]